MDRASYSRRAAGVGFWVFFAGLLLLVLTFVLTLVLFLGIDAALRGGTGSTLEGGAGASPIASLMGSILVKLAALLVMGVCASLVTTQGLRLWLLAGKQSTAAPATDSPAAGGPEPEA